MAAWPTRIFASRPAEVVALRLLRFECAWIARFEVEGPPIRDLEFPESYSWREIAALILPRWSNMVWRLVHELPTVLILGEPRSECPACQGSGQYVGFQVVERCESCGGTGLDLPTAGLLDLRQPLEGE